MAVTYADRVVFSGKGRIAVVVPSGASVRITLHPAATSHWARIRDIQRHSGRHAATTVVNVIVILPLLVLIAANAHGLATLLCVVPELYNLPLFELVTGVLLWLAAPAYGWLLRRTNGGRRRLRLHAAEHIAVQGATITARCGSVVYSRAVAAATLVFVVLATTGSLVGPPAFINVVPLDLWAHATRAFIHVATVLAFAELVRQLGPARQLDPITRWLHESVVLPPRPEEIDACQAAVQALRTGVVPDRYAVSVENLAAAD